MLAALTPNTRVVFVANPNNPTGTPSDGKISRDSSKPCRTMFYWLWTKRTSSSWRSRSISCAEIRNGSRTNLILMRTFSKIYGLAGLRIGYGIGHPDFVAALEKIRQPFNINSVAQAGALAALDDARHIERTRKTNSRGLRLYARTFRRLGLEFIPSSANFILVRVGDRPARFRGPAEAGRDCPAHGRIPVAAMDPHLSRHDPGKPALHRGAHGNWVAVRPGSGRRRLVAGQALQSIAGDAPSPPRHAFQSHED
jgi:hypothetical protein